MPPEVKTETTELQVFNVEKFSIEQLPEFKAKKDEIEAVIALHPIVEIIDNSTYEAAKKSRTAVKTLRTGLEKEQSDVKRKIKNNIIDVVDKEYDLLVLDVKKQESDRQIPITTYETELEAKRQEKARLEQQRVDNIKREINDYVASWKDAFNLMSFESIEKVSADFLESYTSYDLTILEEFEALFPSKIEELTQYLADKTSSLTDAENTRLEIIRLEKEAAELRAEKARLEDLAKIAEASEAKAKKEREDFEKEKAEFEENKRIEAEKLKSVTEVLEAVIIPKTIPTVSPEMHYGVEMEEKAIEAILEAVNPTVNVCSPIINDVVTKEDTVKVIETTWEAIEKDFKSSAEKSYSKWLKDNYNPPTKL